MKECVIHGDAISGWSALYDQICKDLMLPEWFGRNLDALYDCLTDLEDAKITVYRFGALEETLGAKAEALKAALTDAGIDNRSLTVCILDEEADEI